MAIEEFEDIFERCLLRDVIPGVLIGFRGLVDDIQHQWSGERNQCFIFGNVYRELSELPFVGEVKNVSIV